MIQVLITKKKNLKNYMNKIKKILTELFFMIPLRFLGGILMENKQFMVVLAMKFQNMKIFFGIPATLSRDIFKIGQIR